jgi:hypothetical protein
MSSGSSSRKIPRTQTPPGGATPIEDIKIEDLDQQTREKVKRLRQIRPSATVLQARNALLIFEVDLDGAAERLGSDVDILDEIESLSQAKRSGEDKFLVWTLS